MVGIHLFIIPAAVMNVRIHNRLWQQIRRVNGNGVHHRVTAGKVLFWQIPAVRTRIGNELVGFVELLADIKDVLRAQTEAFRRFNLQRGKRERQRRGF